jgi:hypothetical protein
LCKKRKEKKTMMEHGWSQTRTTIKGKYLVPGASPVAPQEENSALTWSLKVGGYTKGQPAAVIMVRTKINFEISAHCSGRDYSLPEMQSESIIEASPLNTYFLPCLFLYW